MGRWSADHWKTATFGWLAFVIVAFGLGGTGRDEDDRPEHRRTAASRVGWTGSSTRASSGPPTRASSSRAVARATDPAFRAAIEDVVASISKLEVVRTSARPSTGNRARSPRTGAPRWSSSRSAATPTKLPTRSTRSSPRSTTPSRPTRSSSSASSATRARSRLSRRRSRTISARPVLLSLPITLVILVIAFGALVAAGIPLLLALTAVFATFGLIALPSHVFPVAMQAPALVLLIGLAVGVDYSMFYLRREREERAAGRSERAALEVAAATSGRSVLVSGLTVIIAMAGMFLTGDNIFASFGVATIIVVAIAMLGSLTVLPALLSRLGDGVDRVRDSVRRPTAPRRRRGPDLGCGHRPRPASAAAVGRPRRRAAGRPRRCRRSSSGWSQPGVDTFPKSLAGSADVRADAGRVPGHGASGERRRQGAERERADDAGGDPAARAARAGQRPHARADHGRRQRRRNGR